MGYLSRFTGEINIEPPIAWSKVKDSKYLNRDGTFFTSIVFNIETIEQDTEYGEAIIRKAISLVPCMEDSYKGYDILNEIQEVIDLYTSNHNFSGEIRAEGEESTDIRRYVVEDNKVKGMKAEIIWPNGRKESMA